jgi:signal transduction histidine kinase
VLVGCWDADRLGQVIGNLLTNAIKYSPEGGTVDVTLARAEDDDGAWAHLSVRDRGLGIPAEDRPRLFERFHRGSNVVGRIVGTGIGLASAARIVRQHGGSIGVESEEGRGSTFTVTLPLSVDGAHGPGCEGAGA